VLAFALTLGHGIAEEEAPAEAGSTEQQESVFQPAPPFSDHAVLQRDKPVNVWGRSVPGDEVTVAFAGQTKTAKTDATGRWMAVLDPMSASAVPATLTMTSKQTGAVAQAKNIVVGDVWFCSGQSNMLWSLMGTTNALETIAKADYPLIRGFKPGTGTAEQAAFEAEGKWVVTTPADELLKSPIRNFSGVAFYFARELHRATGVPVGIIQPALGGTIIEAWMSREALDASPHREKIDARWAEAEKGIPAAYERFTEELALWEKEAAEAQQTGAEVRRRPADPQGISTMRHRPASLWNAMVAPFVPYSISGFLWYQGESNAQRPEEYRDLFPAMIRQWRQDFAQGDLPFYFVQIANFRVKRDPSEETWAFLREAQIEGLREPNTAMAVTIDIGESDNVHPQNKLDVGKRLALHALNDLHGRDVVRDGPQFEAAESTGGTMRVRFAGNPELVLKDVAGAFQIAGEDRKFHPAEATLDGSTLVVASKEVPAPLAVRYAWSNDPPVALFGISGLPAAPFRSDNWPRQTATDTQ